MLNSINSRVVRKNTPRQVITKTNYRGFFKNLSLDFEDRCAYSMQHTLRAGGPKCMEIDHFNPRRKKDRIQQYSNLFLSTRHCNGAKRDRWPKGKDQAAGIRFLNCCKEIDYGVHIFEDPDSHELVGVTPAGKYHVRNCDLNAPHLVHERTQRAKLHLLLTNQAFRLRTDSYSLVCETVEALKAEFNQMIPLIPYLSGEALEKYRARRKALALLAGTSSH